LSVFFVVVVVFVFVLFCFVLAGSYLICENTLIQVVKLKKKTKKKKRRNTCPR